MIATLRFQIRRDGWVRPLLWLFGGTASRGYVEVLPDRLGIKFGWFFHRHVPFSEIASTYPSEWPWYLGLGWRSNLLGRVGLIGSYDGAVEVKLKRKRMVWLTVFPVPCDRYVVTLEDPEGFVTALRDRLPRDT